MPRATTQKVMCGAIGRPGRHQTGDQSVEIGFERKLEQKLGIPEVALAKRVDSQRDTRKALDFRNFLQITRINESAIELAAGNQRDHQVLLQAVVARIEGECTGVKADGVVEIGVGFSNARSKKRTGKGVYADPVIGLRSGISRPRKRQRQGSRLYWFRQSPHPIPSCRAH